MRILQFLTCGLILLLHLLLSRGNFPGPLWPRLVSQHLVDILTQVLIDFQIFLH